MAIDTTYCGEQNQSQSSLTVYPLFGRPNKLSIKTDIFVLMPFNKDIQPIYKEHIIHVTESLKLSVRRADDLYTNNEIIADVWTGIYSAGVVIADCTGRNANVFYELGIAHTLGTPVILITQNKNDIPIDIHHIKYILYDYTPPGMRLFESSLSKTIIEVLGCTIF